MQKISLRLQYWTFHCLIVYYRANCTCLREFFIITNLAKVHILALPCESLHEFFRRRVGAERDHLGAVLLRHASIRH